MASPVSGGDVRRALEQFAPLALAESWDNVGWQLGNDEIRVRGVLMTVDVDAAVLAEALERGANLIVAHHPLFFRPIKQIDTSTFHGQLIQSLFRHEIYVYSAHTNLDAVPRGVNGALAQALGLTPLHPIIPIHGAVDGSGWGVVCDAPPQPTGWFAGRVKERLGTPAPRVTPAPGAPQVHRRVALMGGSGGGFSREVYEAGCTLYITGEIKYHDAQDAARLGVTVIEADHYYSERPVLDVLAEQIATVNVPIYRSRVVTSPYS